MICLNLGCFIMIKRLCVSVLLFAFVICLSVPAFAAEKQGRIFNRNIEDTRQFLVNITRPEGNESTFKKSYVVSGNTDLEDVMVELYKLNKSTNYYEPFENTDGFSRWTVGSSGIFMKEVKLDYGANDIMIVAKRGSEKQVNTFKVTVLDASLKDKIRNGVNSISEILKQIFK